jgi:hypothetical protein
MGSMQGPDSAQGQAVDQSDSQKRIDDLNKKVADGEELTIEEQDELDKLNEEAKNPGANPDEVAAEEPAKE